MNSASISCLKFSHATQPEIWKTSSMTVHAVSDAFGFLETEADNVKKTANAWSSFPSKPFFCNARNCLIAITVTLFVIQNN